MNILLIAGHGGTPYDPGACGCGYTEAVETRRMATAVAPMLRAYGFHVTMYDQKNDAYQILNNGGSIPLSGIDYVLEIHLNACVDDEKGDGKTTGVEVLVHTGEKGITVEQDICRRIAALGFENRGVKRRSGLLVMNTVHQKGISHALIETCFVDDADDMKLYKAKFYEIARAIADGVAEGFGKTVKKEDTEVVEKKKVVIDGAIFDCSCIMKNDENYIRMRDLEQADFTVTYDEKVDMPEIIVPQTRAHVYPWDDEVQQAMDTVQAAAGLEDKTVVYLLKYEYGEELLKKLAKAVQGNA